MTQRVFQFHQLNKYVVFRIQAWCCLRRFEVEREPLLNAFHAGSLGEVEKQCEIENDWRGKYRVTAKKIDLDLHRVTEPAEYVDVVPTFLVVASRRVVVDTDDMRKVLIEIRVNIWLEDVFEDRKF